MQRSYPTKELIRIIESLQALPFHLDAAQSSGLDLDILFQTNQILCDLMRQQETQLEFETPPPARFF